MQQSNACGAKCVSLIFLREIKVTAVGNMTAILISLPAAASIA